MPSPTVLAANNKKNMAASSSPPSSSSDLSSDLLSQSPNLTLKPVGAGATAAARVAPNICRKSYAATLSRPSYDTKGECNGRSDDDDAATATGEGGGSDDAKIRVDAKRRGGADGASMFRTYARGYAKRPSERPTRARKKSRLARKLERGWSKPERLPTFESPARDDDGDGDDGKTNAAADDDGGVRSYSDSSPKSSSACVDPSAPAKFRESYESKNAHSEKNLRNIEAIARAQEDALRISTTVEVPVLQVQVMEGEDECVGREGCAAFSPLTCPASQPAWGQEHARDSEEEEHDNGRVGVEDGKLHSNEDAAGDNIMEQEDEQHGKLEGDEIDAEIQPDKEAGPSLGELERVTLKGEQDENQPAKCAILKADDNSSENDCEAGGWQPDEEEEMAVPATFSSANTSRKSGDIKDDLAKQFDVAKQATALPSTADQANHAYSDENSSESDNHWQHRAEEDQQSGVEDDETKPRAKPSASNKTVSKITNNVDHAAAKQPNAAKQRPTRSRTRATALALAIKKVGEKEDNLVKQSTVAKKRPIRGRKGATALALAADQANHGDSSEDDSESDDHWQHAAEEDQRSDENDERKLPAKRSASTKSTLKKTQHRDHAEMKQPNPAKKRPIRKRRGATALALALEYEETEGLDASHEQDQEEQTNAAKKKGRMRKQGPTALALAEYQETGTVDSYFANRAAERRGGKAKLQEVAQMDSSNNCEEEDHGHTSFHCDHEQSIGSGKQAECVIGTEKQSADPSNGTNKNSEPLLSSAASRQLAAAAESSSNSTSSKAGSEKQLEPLLSLAAYAPSKTHTAEAAAAGRLATKSTSNRSSTLTASEMIVALRSEVDEMGRALICPICQSTLKHAKILPCVHAFCSGCLKDYFSPKPTYDPKNKRRKLSPCKVKNECPVCKVRVRGHRSGVKAPHIDELVQAYKGIGRAFGFAPVVYGADIVMTQLDPEETGGLANMESDEEEDRKMPAIEENDEAKRKRKSDMHEYGQHLQVCQAVHGAFLERTESLQLRHDDLPVNRREQIENRNQVRRLQLLAKEQEAVVAVDEKAFNKARRVGGAKEILAAKTAKFIAEATASERKEGSFGNDKRLDQGNDSTAIRKSKVFVDLEKVDMSSYRSIARKVASKTEHAKDATSDTASGKNPEPIPVESSRAEKSAKATVASEGISNLETNKTEQAKTELDELLVEEYEEFCTAPDESQSVAYSTAREESQGTAPLNVAAVQIRNVNHDGNTVNKAARPKESSSASSNVCSSVPMRDSCVHNGEQSPLPLEKTSAPRRRSRRAATSSRAASIQATALVSTAATATTQSKTSPLVIHDGNTARKIRQDDGSKISNSDARSLLDEVSKSIGFNDGDLPMSRRGGRKKPSPKVSLDFDPSMIFPLPSAAVASRGTASKEDDAIVHIDDRGVGNINSSAPNLGVPAAAASALTSVDRHSEKENDHIIVKGTIVVVQARTWPGINKPGGVARVTKVHPNGNSTKYDVTYILGGREKQVDESFVTLQKVDALETTAEPSPKSARISISPFRPILRRKVVAESSPGRGIPSSTPIYSDEELKHIPAGVLEWAGILPKAKKGKTKAASEGGTKRVLMESNANAKSKATKKRKQKTATNTPATREGSVNTPKEDREPSLSNVKGVKKGSAIATVEGDKGKKRVLTESYVSAKSKPAKQKKRKTATNTPAKRKGGVKTSKQDHDTPPATFESLRGVINLLSKEETIDLADARYYSLLSLDKKPSSSDTLTLHAVTSSLTDEYSQKLNSLCKMLKSNNVILKITKDFNPKKTQLCITAAIASSLKTPTNHKKNEPIIDVVSKSRTLKVMQSALAGIPILTPQWMTTCLEGGFMVAPSGNMCIRTLPRKQAANPGVSEDGNNLPTESFGVAKYAAAFHKVSLLSSNHLFSGFSVLLCGRSAGSEMLKDLKVLTQQAGASIVSSASMASRLLMDISKEGGASLGPFVFLCDDSSTDKTCGISDALFKQVKKLIGNYPNSGESKEAKVLCVHFNWLFDSISCATPMKAAAYAPLAPRSNALWELTTKEGMATAASNTKSQIY